MDKQEDFYSKNKKWKDEMYKFDLFRHKKNESQKLEMENKLATAFPFTPKISKESQKLCETNELFKIHNIYERNRKWKESANKSLQDEQVLQLI
jgi:hypothetical protein